MEDSSQRTITYIGAVIIAILLLGLVFTIVRHNKTRNNLNTEKLNSERLISEKSTIQRELDKLKNDISILKETSDANVKLLSDTEAKLSDTEKRMKDAFGPVCQEEQNGFGRVSETKRGA